MCDFTDNYFSEGQNHWFDYNMAEPESEKSGQMERCLTCLSFAESLLESVGADILVGVCVAVVS